MTPRQIADALRKQAEENCATSDDEWKTVRLILWRMSHAFAEIADEDEAKSLHYAEAFRDGKVPVPSVDDSAADILRSLDADEITVRLEDLDRERKALMVLLRAARRNQNRRNRQEKQ